MQLGKEENRKEVLANPLPPTKPLPRNPYPISFCTLTIRPGIPHIEIFGIAAYTKPFFHYNLPPAPTAPNLPNTRFQFSVLLELSTNGIAFASEGSSNLDNNETWHEVDALDRQACDSSNELWANVDIESELPSAMMAVCDKRQRQCCLEC